MLLSLVCSEFFFFFVMSSVSLCRSLYVSLHLSSYSLSLLLSMFLCVYFSFSVPLSLAFRHPRGSGHRKLSFGVGTSVLALAKATSINTGHPAREGGGSFCLGTTLSPPSLSQRGARSYPVQPRKTDISLCTASLNACSCPRPSLLSSSPRA